MFLKNILMRKVLCIKKLCKQSFIDRLVFIVNGPFSKKLLLFFALFVFQLIACSSSSSWLYQQLSPCNWADFSVPIQVEEGEAYRWQVVTKKPEYASYVKIIQWKKDKKHHFRVICLKPGPILAAGLIRLSAQVFRPLQSITLYDDYNIICTEEGQPVNNEPVRKSPKKCSFVCQADKQGDILFTKQENPKENNDFVKRCSISQKHDLHVQFKKGANKIEKGCKASFSPSINFQALILNPKASVLIEFCYHSSHRSRELEVSFSHGKSAHKISAKVKIIQGCQTYKVFAKDFKTKVENNTQEAMPRIDYAKLNSFEVKPLPIAHTAEDPPLAFVIRGIARHCETGS